MEKYFLKSEVTFKLWINCQQHNPRNTAKVGHGLDVESSPLTQPGGFYPVSSSMELEYGLVIVGLFWGWVEVLPC